MCAALNQSEIDIGKRGILIMVTLPTKFKHMYTCIFVKALIHSGVNMITQECLDRIMKFEYNIVNENITDEVDSGHCSVKVKVTT